MANEQPPRLRDLPKPQRDLVAALLRAKAAPAAEAGGHALPKIPMKSEADR